ncbi:4-alpha-glucanotransferase [Gallaecimonas kandeliae]|uniref:4-alpha-glucanotransferase n=1 Tax=Gallaecimonas kandeliae TaxID=3029055 RepID=UPI002647069B|nr:4-alpha-glucanotransferase [Gallaecimonas kandeliae]WKE64813.1 4-alpha-glucanotransferase [Gallaecimonas kandeliae]
MKAGIFAKRRAGVLLHPSSLPGDPWQGAMAFLDFLQEAGFGLWQMLPIGPTHGDLSPYSLLSAHAGNSAFLSPRWLAGRGWGGEGEGWLTQGAERFFASLAAAPGLASQYQDFCSRQAQWLEDYALFMALREALGGQSWVDWPEPLRRRDDQALAAERLRLATPLARHKFIQFAFEQQWQALRAEAHSRGILLFGDMPIFVAHDSADVWANQRLFNLDEAGQPLVVAGVPPDYFSATGQRWGNPLYRWRRMEEEGFGWWLSRLEGQLALFDLIRIDHFRGFEACWEIPADGEARDGRWVKVPGEALLAEMARHHQGLPLVAENLGIITPEVEALREHFSLPGMLVLQFAFDGGAANPYLPHNHQAMEVVYTGTHDNDTSLGWYQALSGEAKEGVMAYLGLPGEPMPWPLINAALASVARLAVLPMQDLLALDSSHRMNTPGTVEGNWRWRFDWQQLPPELAQGLRRRLARYGRLG